ncbi:hypothetical protein AB4Z50_03010 [Paenibacillus sp. 2TAB26]|uniref:DUF7002 family protein n=1 Tax=Paenibacillus sp. 2TAB26 TaxID=3233005 RepID=UPI003F951E80
MDKKAIVSAITKSKGRKSLYHFTRVRNLPAIVHHNALWSSKHLYPFHIGERRSEVKEVKYFEHTVVINAHLRIVESMMDANCTHEQFRAYLDQHVFFWPTLKDCRKMLDTYKRREQDEAFVILQFEAFPLLMDHYSAVKLSKYDSGSSPRFPKSCKYKKSLEMFLSLDEFQKKRNNTVPVKASEIHELLFKDQVINLNQYVQVIYADHDNGLPENWRKLVKPLESFS